MATRRADAASAMATRRAVIRVGPTPDKRKRIVAAILHRSWLRKFSLGFRPSLDGPIITASFFGRTLFDVICMDNRS
ncbi:hypothetical protein LTSEADE_4205 [Salmonella enterica subsp. enterica serovar Adelaide str. A4-669]|uniref:Uncharacterized protein n=1 Tax=Salmonella enterica subsp. enterica serovar Adelaide str. A4-669 TaxID=913063 RepID=A0A6C8GJQ2_SALET|nr:hypothetical protein LTSEADE_4205 [Salmonella enterica subsp. enterica serovar Adelaide str. A4-669]